MFIEPKYEEIVYKSEIKKLLSETKIECKTQLTADEVVKVLSVSAQVSLTGEEVTASQFRYGGKALFCVAYLAADGAVKKAECGTEFSNSLKTDFAESVYSETALCVKKASAEIGGGILVVHSVVGAETCFYADKSAKALTGGENLIVKKANVKTVREIKVASAVFPLEEEFEVPYAVGDVVLHTACAAVTASQCGVGTLICDGELILSVCMLQKIENSDILKETKCIPFRYELEAEEVSPSLAAQCKAALKDLKINIAVDENTGKSTLAVSAQVEIGGCYFKENETECCLDCYSPLCEVTMSKSECTSSCPAGEKTFEKRVGGRGAFTGALPAGTRLMCTANEKATLTSVRAENDVIAVEGVLEAVALCKDIEGKVFAAELTAPFRTSLEYDVGENRYSVEAIACESAARIVSPESFDLDALVKFRVTAIRTASISVVGDVEEGEEKKPAESAISVYIPIEGEELWDVAKRLNSCPDAIASMNADLAYPLSGKERIVIYRQEKKDY